MKRSFIRLLALAGGLALLGLGPAHAQRIGADSVDALSARKLQLEVGQLENQEALSLAGNRTWGRVVGVLSSSLVSTLITLGVGGLLFSILADRRARRNHNLDKAIETVDRVAGDLNGALTLLNSYIRRGNFLDSPEVPGGGSLPAYRKRVAVQLEGKVADLFSKRFAVSVQAQAFIEGAGRGWVRPPPMDFVARYRLLARNMELLVRLTGLVYASPQGHGKGDVIRERRAALIKEWPLESEIQPRALKPPFDELNQWAEEVSARAADLLTSTLRHLLR
jgi:hypothetical protein